MFEPLPEKPPHFALHRVALVALAGGIVGIFIGILLLGEEPFTSGYVALFGSFGVGAFVGGLLGWKLVMPAGPPSSSEG